MAATDSTERWFTRQRLRIYPRIFIGVYSVIIIFWTATQFLLADEPPNSLRNDFAGFWSVGQLVLESRSAEAYIPQRAYEAQEKFIPDHEVRLPWFYPPQFFFVVGSLARLPFLPAFFVWTLGSVVCLAFALRAVAPHPLTIWIFLASPGLFWTLRWGQSGILAAALIGGAVYLMARRKHIGAGVLTALLTFKPHLGLLIPFALIAARQWRVFAVAATTTVLMAGFSTLAFGPEIWTKFLGAIETSFAMQLSGALPANQMVSISAFLNSLGSPPEIERVAQLILSIFVLIVICFVWWRSGPSLLSGAVLIAGSLLVTPHILGYDLMLFAPAIAILAWDGFQRGWLRGERTSLALLWLWPWISESIQHVTRVNVGVVGSLLLFVLVYRRHQVTGCLVRN